MDDIFSKIVSIILMVILLCIIPAFYISIYTDVTRYLYNNNQMTSFLDEIIYTGSIKDNELLRNDNFEIIVERKIYLPDYEEIKNISLTKNTINEKILNNSIYKFDKGDLVTVVLKNDNRSDIFFNKIFNINNNVSYLTYSGVVKNECY